MQDKSEHYSEFSERTDQLAAALNISVSSLTDVLKISNGMLFGYRGGKNPISRKAWSKLESAEVHLKAGGRGYPERADVPAGSPRYGLNEDAAARPMPTRADCESYLRTLLNAAEADGAPENIPAIYHRLKKLFPLAEWETKPE